MDDGPLGAIEHGQRGAAVPLVAFVVDGRRWALPLAAVDRVVAMVAVSPLPRSPAGVRGAVNVHGEIVPVLDLESRLGLQARDRGPEAQLVLARTSRRTVAVAVDEALGVLEVEHDAIGAPTDAGSPGIAGIAALADGLLVIHDLDAFLSAGDEALLAGALAEAAS
jgi:purine-binding chemotaxis protein CheW